MKITPVHFFSPVKQIMPQKQAATPVFGRTDKDFFNYSTDKYAEYRLKDALVVGRSTLTDKKTGEKSDVVITCQLDTAMGDSYTMWELKNDGSKEYMGDVNLYPSEHQGKPAAYIVRMVSVYPKTKGIGTLLHQIAIERSMMLDCGGQVYFDIYGDSEPFHYNCGYREDADSQKAYLPDEVLAQWKEKIAKNPCLLVRH